MKRVMMTAVRQNFPWVRTDRDLLRVLHGTGYALDVKSLNSRSDIVKAVAETLRLFRYFNMYDQAEKLYHRLGLVRDLGKTAWKAKKLINELETRPGGGKAFSQQALKAMLMSGQGKVDKDFLNILKRSGL